MIEEIPFILHVANGIHMLIKYNYTYSYTKTSIYISKTTTNLKKIFLRGQRNIKFDFVNLHLYE